MDIKYCVQKLEFKFAANRYNKKIAETLLLKIDQKYFLNYHPWGEFGDISVTDFLENIRKTSSLPFFMRDNLKQEVERNQIEHKPFLNHKFGSSNYKLPIKKIKFLGSIDALLAEIKTSNEKLRIDFNLGLSCEEFLAFWSSLDKELKEKIDFFEDPCEIRNQVKNLKGIPIASDRFSYPCEIEKIKIFKPSIETKPEGNNFIVSSYMGHDLGIYHTYLKLMRSGDLSKFHGVVTPPVYLGSKKLFKFDGLKFTIDLKKISEVYKELNSIEWKTI